MSSRETIVVTAPDLDEAHPALDQSPRDETLPAEVIHLLLGVDVFGPGRRIPFDAMKVEQIVRLLEEIHRLGRG
jgi:hypothetical protein